MNDVQRTAYHEAGHAAIDYLLNRPVRSITIVPSDEYLGCCVTDVSPLMSNIVCGDERAVAILRDHILSFLGGPIAEFLHKYVQEFDGLLCAPIPRWDEVNLRLTKDEEDAVDLLFRTDAILLPDGSYDVGTPGEKAFDDALDLVAEYWWVIDAIAGALLERQTVQGVELDDIVRAAERSKVIRLVERVEVAG